MNDKKHTSPRDSELPTIFDLFFGQISHFLKLKSDEREKTLNTIKEKMGPIILDANNHSNLYAAW